jgi:hypothetical protein
MGNREKNKNGRRKEEEIRTPDENMWWEGKRERESKYL